MNAEMFAYWLQGFVELTQTPQPSEAQWQAIKDHLQLVFKKETPNRLSDLFAPQPLLGNPPFVATC